MKEFIEIPGKFTAVVGLYSAIVHVGNSKEFQRPRLVLAFKEGYDYE